MKGHSCLTGLLWSLVHVSQPDVRLFLSVQPFELLSCPAPCSLPRHPTPLQIHSAPASSFSDSILLHRLLQDHAWSGGMIQSPPWLNRLVRSHPWPMCSERSHLWLYGLTQTYPCLICSIQGRSWPIGSYGVTRGSSARYDAIVV